MSDRVEAEERFAAAKGPPRLEPADLEDRPRHERLVPDKDDVAGNVDAWDQEFRVRNERFEHAQEALDWAHREYVSAFFDLVVIGANLHGMVEHFRRSMESAVVPPRGDRPRADHVHRHEHRGGRAHEHPHEAGRHHGEEET